MLFFPFSFRLRFFFTFSYSLQIILRLQSSFDPTYSQLTTPWPRRKLFTCNFLTMFPCCILTVFLNGAKWFFIFSIVITLPGFVVRAVSTFSCLSHTFSFIHLPIALFESFVYIVQYIDCRLVVFLHRFLPFLPWPVL